MANDNRREDNTGHEHIAEAQPFPESAPEQEVNGHDLTPELQVPRKREREISLEPATPQSTTSDLDTGRKETRVPIKKNKLDATEEEPPESSVVTPSHSRSGSPTRALADPAAAALCASPPIETKVRHISRRVSDIHWRNEDVLTEAKVEMDVQANDGPGALEAAAEITAMPGYVQPETREIELETASMAGSQDSDKEGEHKIDGQGEENGMRRRSTDSVTGAKRPREEAENDANPRETKRPSPPPEKAEPSSSKPALAEPKATPKLGGFMAYASTSAPFASTPGKSQSTFGASKPKPTFGSPSPFAPSSFSALGASSSAPTPPPTEPASPTPSALFQSSGFAAFATSASPFAAASRSRSPSSGPSRPKSPAGKSRSPYGDRAKSPPTRPHSKSSAGFTSYASGGAQGFGMASPLGAPVSKRSRAMTPAAKEGANANATDSGEESPQTSEEEAPSPNNKRSFGDVLREGKDGEEDGANGDKVELSEKTLTTGEENEETLYQVRGKLFTLAAGNQWKERGTGMLKLNVQKADGSSPRLVMRKEAVLSLLLNITLFKGMHIALAQDPRYLRFSAIEEGHTTHYNLRVSNAKIAGELLEEINSNIPT